ncbi:type VI secretion system tube protein TssD [Serratia microhaemolytica]|uniref:type VI secretion system tube protein TssD n=1 Tax=Serratia microhaemolytica TaxID=2675110 RepID=UPI000FDE91E0|nr:type VI secretion system tube protein TssD [Serratia microhaemolytica]
MSYPIYLTMIGEQQGDISRNCGSYASLGNAFQAAHPNEMSVHSLFADEIGQPMDYARRLTFSKSLDRATPLLAAGIDSSERYFLDFYLYRINPAGALEQFYHIELRGASIASFALHLDSLTGQQIEHISVRYDYIRCRHLISNTEYSYFALPENYNQLFTRLNPIIAARTASKTQNGYLNAADQVRKSALDRKASIGTLNANEQQQRASLVKKAAQQQQNLFTACEDETSAACLAEHKKLLQAQESYRGYAEYQTYYDLREQFPDEMAHYAELIGDYSHQLIGLLENGYTLEQAKAKLAQDQAESVEYARKYQEAVDKLPTWARIAMTIQDTVGMVYGAKAAGVGLGNLCTKIDSTRKTSPLRYDINPSGLMNSEKLTLTNTVKNLFRQQKVREALDVHYEDLVRKKLGGTAKVIGGREYDVVTDKAIVQVKRTYSAVDKPKNFLSKSTRMQIKKTIELANQQGKEAQFWFKYGVHPTIRAYIEEKGGKVMIGLGD